MSKNEDIVPIKVLYVDDEPSLLELTKIFLEKEGVFDVVICDKPATVSEILESGKFDVLISDYDMPVMNGIQLLKELRASENNIPFIIFTGRGREEVVIEALNNGADFYLQKGGDPRSQYAELVNKITYAVNKKRMQSALKHQAAMDASLDGMALLDVNMVINYANRALSDTYGYSGTDDMIGMKWNDLFLESDMESFKQNVEQVFSSGEKYSGRLTGQGLDGNPIPLQISISQTMDDSFIAVIRDISEEIKAENEIIRQSELQRLLAMITHSFIYANLDQKDDVVEQSLSEIGEALRSDRVYVFEYDHDSEHATNIYEWCAQGIEPQIDFLKDIPFKEVPEFVEAHFTGQSIHIEDVDAMPDIPTKSHLQEQGIKSLLTMPFFDQDVCIGFIGFDSVAEHHFYTETEHNVLNVFADMLACFTKRNCFIGIIQEMNLRNNALLTAFPDMMFLIDKKLVFVDHNAPLETNLMKEPQHFIGKSIYEVLDNELADRTVKAIGDLDAEGHSDPIVYDMVFDEYQHYFESRVVKCGENYMAIVRDVTEREISRILLEHNERLRSLAETFAKVGSWEYTVDDGYLFWSKECESVFGLEEGEFNNTYEEFISHVHPDDRELVRSVNRPITELKEGVNLEYDHRIITKDGETRWVREVAGVIKDGNGRPERIIGLISDISDSKIKELELNKREELLSMLISRTPVVIYSYRQYDDGTLDITFINDNVTDILGFRPDHFVGNMEFWYSCLHPEDIGVEYNETESGTMTKEYRFKDIDGLYHLLHDQRRILRRESDFIEFVGVWWDVTENNQ